MLIKFEYFRCSHLLESTLGLPLFAQFCVSGVVLCTSAYQLTMVSLKNLNLNSKSDFSRNNSDFTSKILFVSNSNSIRMKDLTGQYFQIIIRHCVFHVHDDGNIRSLLFWVSDFGKKSLHWLENI